MKVQNMIISATLLTSLLGGSVTALAQEYPDATTGNVDSTIQFIEDDQPVDPVDPDDPNNPIIPDDPTNPNGAELMITYASNLNFGEQSKSGTSWNALADTVRDSDGNQRSVTPFVSTKDSRGTDRDGWVLSVKQDADFTDEDANVLAGAELSFANLYYANVAGAPTASSGNIVLNNTAQEVAQADDTTGVGQWSLGLGTLQEDNTTNGVTLNVPSTSAKNTATYSTTVTWELTADPAK